MYYTTPEYQYTPCWSLILTIHFDIFFSIASSSNSSSSFFFLSYRLFPFIVIGIFEYSLSNYGKKFSFKIDILLFISLRLNLEVMIMRYLHDLMANDFIAYYCIHWTTVTIATIIVDARNFSIDWDCWSQRYYLVDLFDFVQQLASSFSISKHMAHLGHFSSLVSNHCIYYLLPKHLQIALITTISHAPTKYFKIAPLHHWDMDFYYDHIDSYLNAWGPIYQRQLYCL